LPTKHFFFGGWSRNKNNRLRIRKKTTGLEAAKKQPAKKPQKKTTG